MNDYIKHIYIIMLTTKQNTISYPDSIWSIKLLLNHNKIQIAKKPTYNHLKEIYTKWTQGPINILRRMNI